MQTPRAGRAARTRYEPTKSFALPYRDVLRPAAFSQIHGRPNTDSAICADCNELATAC
jgi:hypothetical protein